MPRSLWQRLCPLGEWRDPLLAGIESTLAEDEVRVELAACESEGRYPESVLARLAALGLGRLFAESSTAYHLNALNALAARQSGSLAIILGINGLALLPIHLAATPEQRAAVFAEVREGALAAMLLSEWDHGSDLLATATRARPGTLEPGGRFVAADPGRGEAGGPAFTHYQVSGEKRLINGVTRARLLVTLVRTSEREPETRDQVFQGAMGLSLLLVRPDATVEPLERHRTVPVKGADIAGVRFCNTLVPAAELIGKPGEGYALAQKALNLSRGGISAFAVGTSRRATELALGHARSRVLYGKPIIALDAVAEHLARMLALDTALTCLSLKALAAVNALGQGAAHLTAVAKYACCELAEAVVAEGRRVLGARSLIQGPFEAVMRDVLVLGVFDGTSHIMLEHIQWRLTQMLSRQMKDTDSLAELEDMYRRGPESLGEVVGRGGRMPFLPDIGRHMGRLAAIADEPCVRSAHELALAFTRVAGRLVTGDAWKSDQVVRHGAAALLAYLEAMAAIVEIAAPAVRSRLGMPDALAMHDTDEPAHAVPWQLAVLLLGAQVARDLRQLMLGARLEDPGDLTAIEAALLGQYRDAAKALRHTLQTTRESMP